MATNRSAWVSSDKYPGVRWYTIPGRKNGIRLDRCFGLRYQLGGKRHETVIGWESAGKTEAGAALELEGLREAYRTGSGPTTRKERREAKAREKAAESARNVTLADYWTDTYVPWAKATKPAALGNEEGHWRYWIGPNLGTVPIREIRLEQWDHLVKALSAAGLSQRTREYITGTLRRILKHARERRIVTEAPPTGKMVGATAPKDNRRLRILTGNELQSLLDEIKMRDVNAWRVTLFAAITGCRASEAFTLRWRNVDLDAAKITFTDTKNASSRSVPLPADLGAVLEEVGPGAPDSRVFLNTQGNPYTVAPHTFRTAANYLGLNEGRPPRERVSFHSLRHGAATKYAQTLNLRDLMDLFGWKVPAMALRYTHGNEEGQRAALESGARSITGKRGKVLEMGKTRAAK